MGKARGGLCRLLRTLLVFYSQTLLYTTYIRLQLKILPDTLTVVRGLLY